MNIANFQHVQFSLEQTLLHQGAISCGQGTCARAIGSSFHLPQVHERWHMVDMVARAGANTSHIVLKNP